MRNPLDYEKYLLRESYKGIRKKLLSSTTPDGFNKKSQLDSLVLSNLISNINFKSYSAVLCYISFGIEVDTHRLLEYLINQGIPIYVPKCYKNNSSMRFFAIDSLESLTSGEYKGILEPMEDASRELVNFSNCLCIVPALAFDSKGYRLGWGGGYYDRFFSKHEGVFKVGINYNICMAETLPKEGFDISMDWVVTENNILLCGGNNEY